jgi:hypothetical protein
MRFPSLTLAVGALLAIAAGPGMAADVEAGKIEFKKCAVPHYRGGEEQDRTEPVRHRRP